MPPSKPCVVCASGGMDSTSLLLRMLARGRSVFAISFLYGQKHQLELQRLKANLQYLTACGHRVQHHTVDLSSIQPLLHSALTDPDRQIPIGHYEHDSMKETVVPNRNAIFASIAYAHALSLAGQQKSPVEFALGVHSGDHAIYPDCTPRFYQAITAAFEIGNWDSGQVELQLPYLHWDKFQILKDAQQSIETLGLDFETVFRNTLTSYQPDADGRSHGMTGSDVERILAFHRLGIADPIEYPAPWDEVVEQALTIEREFRDNQNLPAADVRLS